MADKSLNFLVCCANGAGSSLMAQMALEKVLKDYFDLSARVKEMHTEIFSLREQLAQAATLQCVNKECLQRTQSEASISEA